MFSKFLFLAGVIVAASLANRITFADDVTVIRLTDSPDLPDKVGTAMEAFSKAVEDSDSSGELGRFVKLLSHRGKLQSDLAEAERTLRETRKDEFETTDEFNARKQKFADVVESLRTSLQELNNPAKLQKYQRLAQATTIPMRVEVRTTGAYYDADSRTMHFEGEFSVDQDPLATVAHQVKVTVDSKAVPGLAISQVPDVEFARKLKVDLSSGDSVLVLQGKANLAYAPESGANPLIGNTDRKFDF